MGGRCSPIGATWPAGLDVIMERVPATFLLMGSGMSMAIILGMLIGILGAVRRYSVFDYLATTGAMVTLSFPTFWFGLMTIFIFALKLGWLPSGGMFTLGGDEDILDLLEHLILPTVVLALVLVAQWSRYTRSSFLEVIHQDYIRGPVQARRPHPVPPCVPQRAPPVDRSRRGPAAVAFFGGTGDGDDFRVAGDGAALRRLVDDERIPRVDGDGHGHGHGRDPWEPVGRRGQRRH
jgi:hypothetical protein